MRRLLGLSLLAGLLVSGWTAAADAPWRQQTSSDNLPAAALLSIAVLPFDSGLGGREIAPTARALREAEARYAAFAIRQALDEARQWGPVRLLPASDPLFELALSGRLDHSTPRRLTLTIRVADSSGRQWFERQFSHTVAADAYDGSGIEPFLPLYQQVAADLADHRDALSLAELTRLQQLAKLRHATVLAPGVFEGYLKTDDGGLLQVNRLPARDDPMTQRLERVRQAQELFADAVDQHFVAYGVEMKDTYLAWRRINLESAQTMATYRKIESRREKATARQRYNALREAKFREQTLRESIASFAFEVGPTTVALDGQMVHLSGTLEQQQTRWGELIRALFERETGLPLTD